MITFVRADGSEFQLPSGPEFGTALFKIMQESGLPKNSPGFLEELERRYGAAFGLPLDSRASCEDF